MTQHRSYFTKSDTIISTNLTNNSQNPVTEIAYGGLNNEITRFIFDIDLEPIITKINNGLINPNLISKHTLRMTNTISNAEQYIGKKSYSLGIDRASSFSLDLFNITEDWDEGSGYDLIHTNLQTNQIDTTSTIVSSSPNWKEKRTNEDWDTLGIYVSGTTQIINNQLFETGAEDIEIDITDYVNYRLLGTGYTGTTIFTGDTYGLGIKFNDQYENLTTAFLQAVAFHTNKTNTFYEPYIETIINDTITDDRNHFFLDKDNDLYLYSNIGNQLENIVVNKVEIYDYLDCLIAVYSGNSITNVSKGVYKIVSNISSLSYPDAILFTDTWYLTINNREVKVSNQFYLISQDNYYKFNDDNNIDLRNYNLNYWGIGEGEYIKNNENRRIRLSIRELYSNQNNNLPLDIEYRLFTTIASKYELEIIPYTKVNRTMYGYEFNLDSSWLIPQDYYLQVRLRNGNYYNVMERLKFSVVENKVK